MRTRRQSGSSGSETSSESHARRGEAGSGGGGGACHAAEGARAALAAEEGSSQWRGGSSPLGEALAVGGDGASEGWCEAGRSGESGREAAGEAALERLEGGAASAGGGGAGGAAGLGEAEAEGAAAATAEEELRRRAEGWVISFQSDGSTSRQKAMWLVWRPCTTPADDCATAAKSGPGERGSKSLGKVCLKKNLIRKSQMVTPGSAAPRRVSPPKTPLNSSSSILTASGCLLPASQRCGDVQRKFGFRGESQSLSSSAQGYWNF